MIWEGRVQAIVHPRMVTMTWSNNGHPLHHEVCENKKDYFHGGI